MEDTFTLYSFKTKFGSFSNYSYLIIDNSYNHAFIVDPAWDLREIIKILNSTNSTLKAILLTHSHYDHVNMVKQLIELYDAKVYMSKKEAEYYRYFCENLYMLEDMEDIFIGNTKVTCLLTPGHTLGGMCFWTGECLFTGDTIFIEGCGLCSGPGGSARQMYDSIQKIKHLMPSSIRVYPGHSYGKEPGQTIYDLYRENIYFQIDDEQCFVDFRMRKKQKGLFDFK